MLSRFCFFPAHQIMGSIYGTYIGFIAGYSYFRTLEENSAASITGGAIVIALTVLSGAMLGNYAAIGMGTSNFLIPRTTSENQENQENQENTAEDLEAGNASPKPPTK
jgi:mannose/fructose/N-acetylgalactosamine-specific phosphotransferase system component IID